LKTQPYDIIIIGAGPIGLACGIEAQKAGLNYTIIDKGCLVNSIYNYPNNMTFFSTSEKLEIGLVPFISHQPKPNRQEALVLCQDKEQNNLRLFLNISALKSLAVATAMPTFFALIYSKIALNLN